MLRDYQQELIDQTREAFRGHKSVVMQLPTGGGKTITTAWIIQNAKGRCIFCVHRIELLYQTSDTFKRMGIDHGFIAASEDYDPDLRVHIASIDTLQRRLDDVAAPDLLVIDEAHRAMADGWRKVANHWPDAHRLLITATPERLDGRGLKHVAEVMVCGKSPRWLTEHGFLAPCRIFSPAVPDMAGIQTRGGDYAQEQLAAMMDKSTITGNAVEHYNKHCEGMQAIVFCVNIDHSRHVAAQFADAGIPAAHLDGTFGKIAREDIIERYRYGETRVLCNVNILTEGFDVPGVQAAIMLRPTKSLALYLQMVGRALRSMEGKTAIILDHAGNAIRHGHPSIDRDWSLEGKKGRKKNKVQLTTCEKCFCSWQKPPRECPNCGWAPETKEREINTESGTLSEITVEDNPWAWAKNRTLRDVLPRAQTYDDLLQIAKIRGYKSGWAYYQWKSRNQTSQG